MSSELAGAIEEIEAEEYRAHPHNRDPPRGHGSQITLHQRMMSACAGSLITSVAVTPFDVVRIRMQQQQVFLPRALAHGEMCCKDAVPPTHPLHSKNSLQGKHATAFRSGSTFTEHVLSEYCATNATCAQDSKIRGTFSGITRIYATEGFPSLYRGLSLVLLMAIPSNVVYFSGYEYLRDSSPIGDYALLNPLLCGSFARVLSATSVAPIELLKTRLQAIPATAQLDSRRLMSLVLRNSWDELRLSGATSLFRGLQITLWRDVPFSGIYWASYEFISPALQRHVPALNLRSTTADGPGSISKSAKIDYKIFVTSFLSGCFSGIIAAVATNPFDVGKTRLQVSSRQHEEAMFKFLLHMVRNEGFRSLYIGLLPRCLKIAPSCAIMISTYELSKRFFSQTR